MCIRDRVIPMQQHIGAPCKPVVKAGDPVCVGQIIGNSDAYVSAPDVYKRQTLYRKRQKNTTATAAIKTADHAPGRFSVPFLFILFLTAR